MAFPGFVCWENLRQLIENTTDLLVCSFSIFLLLGGLATAVERSWICGEGCGTAKGCFVAAIGFVCWAYLRQLIENKTGFLAGAFFFFCTWAGWQPRLDVEGRGSPQSKDG